MFSVRAAKRFMFRSMFRVASLGVLAVTSSTRLSAAPVAKPRVAQKVAAKLPLATQKFLMSLPNPKQTQAQVLTKLAAQLGGTRLLPAYPNDNLLIWNSLRMAEAGEDADKARPLVYDALKIAQKLLLSPQVREKRRAMALASSAVLRVAVVLHDSALACRVYEGFMLPYLEAASTDITLDGSRYNILRDAGIFYQTAKEQDRWNAALDALLPVALAADREFPKGQASADWVYIKMADRDHAAGRDAQALDSLSRVKDASLATGLQPFVDQLTADERSIEANAGVEKGASPSSFVRQQAAQVSSSVNEK